MGKGVIHARSSKQTLNSKSSTETELIGGSDYLPYALWHIYFLKSQGYEVECKMLYQDNESTIKLLKNGKQSSRKQTRHIDIRYFWISDRLKKEKIKVEYCPTKCMLADFFTKPLTGALFNTFRDITQGISPIEELKNKHTIKNKKANNDEGSSVHKECVEEKVTNNQNEHKQNKDDENITNENAGEEKHMIKNKNSAYEIKKK